MRKILGLLWNVTMSNNILPMIISQQHLNSKISIQNNIVIKNPQNSNYVTLKNNFMIYEQEQWNYHVPAVVKSIIN